MAGPLARTVINIAAAGAGNAVTIAALADDGTIWIRSISAGKSTPWSIIEPIPGATYTRAGYSQTGPGEA